MAKSFNLKDSHIRVFSFGIILLFSILPLLLTFPYRVNIYVSWEGAYRMYLGQVPFKDFGLPLGYGFWLIPFLFFKVFGPYMITLIKAQAFINFISLYTFRAILKLFKLNEAVIFFAILVMCLSFTLINFWPWYNHTVFFYGLIAVYFVLYFIVKQEKIYFISISILFVWLSILTKQDGGVLTFLVVFSLLLIDYLYTRNWKPFLISILSFVVLFMILVFPFLGYDFGYWFNYGQAPHYSRVSSYHFINDIFRGSEWIKAYSFGVLLVILYKYNKIGLKSLIRDKSFIIFTLFILGILIQAALIQVTSFSPPTVNLYFHSFAFAYLIWSIQDKINFKNAIVFFIVFIALFVWKSENYWKYSQPIFAKVAPSLFTPPPPEVVSKGNWAARNDSLSKPEPVVWVEPKLKTFKKMRIPQNTLEGINSILNLDIVRNREKKLHVLNMSNLTSLAYELNYVPPKGEKFPLWYHKGVALFDREIDMLCEQIRSMEYDIIIFEDMPIVDNFFPYEVRECAIVNYERINKFLSPTGYVTDSVEVYIRKIR